MREPENVEVLFHETGVVVMGDLIVGDWIGSAIWPDYRWEWNGKQFVLHVGATPNRQSVHDAD